MRPSSFAVRCACAASASCVACDTCTAALPRDASAPDTESTRTAPALSAATSVAAGVVGSGTSCARESLLLHAGSANVTAVKRNAKVLRMIRCRESSVPVPASKFAERSADGNRYAERPGQKHHPGRSHLVNASPRSAGTTHGRVLVHPTFRKLREPLVGLAFLIQRALQQLGMVLQAELVCIRAQ